MKENAITSADIVAIDFQGTRAELVRAVVNRALDALLANRQITIVPSDGWDYYYVPDPPYMNPLFERGSKT